MHQLFIYLFIYLFLFLAVLGLRLCARALSSCGERGPLFIAVRGPLTIAASLVAEHRLQTCRLSSCGSRSSCSSACGIFPDQGSNSCTLHWQADSQPLRHQGSPLHQLLKKAISQDLAWGGCSMGKGILRVAQNSLGLMCKVFCQF